MEFRDYFLVGVCVVAALLLFFKMAKENKVFIGAGILCLCFGGYIVGQNYLNENVVSILSWVLRGIAVIMLIWMFTVLSGERARTKAAKAENAEDKSDTSEKNTETTEENNAE